MQQDCSSDAVELRHSRATGDHMSYTVKPLTNHGLAAELRGLNLGQPIRDQLRAELNEAFAQYHVLVFRDQSLTPAQFAEAGKIFGELMPQNHKASRTVEGLEVYNITNEEVAPGKYQIPGETFHTDHSHVANPPIATALHAVSIPRTGGDTQFVDVHQAYETLSESIRRKIDPLKAVHVWLSKHSPRELRAIDEETRRSLPPAVTHPLVGIHPQNGRKYLYLNPVRMEGIVGLPENEALELINELMLHATQQRFEYRHKWVLGDMVIWDNRSVMHQANADYDMRERRHLYRIVINNSAQHKH